MIRKEYSDEYWVNITLDLIRNLSKGSTLKIGDNYPLAMGEDFGIGWLYNGKVVSAELSFRDVLELLKKNDIHLLMLKE